MKNRMKMIWTALVGEIGQGKCSKAWIEPTDWITHQMRGLGTWLQGGASCLYWKASIPIFPQPLTGFSTRLKGYCRQRLPAQPPQKCQVEQEVPCAKPSPKRHSLQLNAKGRGGRWVLTPGGLFLVRSLVSDLEVTPADPVEE